MLPESLCDDDQAIFLQPSSSRFARDLGLTNGSTKETQSQKEDINKPITDSHPDIHTSTQLMAENEELKGQLEQVRTAENHLNERLDLMQKDHSQQRESYETILFKMQDQISALS